MILSLHFFISPHAGSELPGHCPIPQAAAFGTNPAMGVPDISIPLFRFQHHGYQLPLSLKYNPTPFHPGYTYDRRACVVCISAIRLCFIQSRIPPELFKDLFVQSLFRLHPTAPDFGNTESLLEQQDHDTVRCKLPQIGEDLFLRSRSQCGKIVQDQLPDAHGQGSCECQPLCLSTGVAAAPPFPTMVSIPLL